MPYLSKRSVEASRHRAGSPTGTGMICDWDDIIGIPASRNARRVLSTRNRWATRSATDLFRCVTLCAAAAATAGGIAVVKIKLGAAERIASQITVSAAM